MFRSNHRKVAVSALALVAVSGSRGLVAQHGQNAVPIDWTKVAEALGQSGSLQPGDVYKVGIPRSDLRVMVGQIAIKPTLALGSWVAFKQVGANETVMMGDLVLLEAEVTPVIARLQEGGVEPTAIHNHLFDESPHILYVHIHAHGDPIAAATAVNKALAPTKTPLGQGSTVSSEPIGLDTSMVSRLIGWPGKVNGGVYQIGVPRAETITDGGMEVPPSMGVATAINFQPIGDQKAIITGDFVLIAKEVGSVMRALQQNGISVTALHSHMLEESPRLFFMHFWGNGDATKLAKGLRAALDKTNIKATR